MNKPLKRKGCYFGITKLKMIIIVTLHEFKHVGVGNLSISFFVNKIENYV